MKTWKWTFAVMAMVAVLGFVTCGGDNGDNNSNALTGTVTITGTMQVGEASQNVATANITDSNGTAGKFTYKWTRTKDGGNAVIIATINVNTYTITDADVNHTLGVVVTNDDKTGERSGTAESKVAMKDSADRDPITPNEPLFNDSQTNYFVDIFDARTGLRYETLEQLGVVSQLTGAISAAYNGAGNATKGRFESVFIEGVTIAVNNSSIYYEGPQTPDRYTMNFHIDYLTDVDLADLQQAITAIIRPMNELPYANAKVMGHDTFRLAGVPPIPQYTNAQRLRDNRVHATVADTEFPLWC